jgi:acetoin utilization protein AcuB
MLVVERMSRPVVTIAGKTTVDEALATMEERQLRHLPVLDAQEAVVGILSEKDLLKAGEPWTVDRIMTKHVITVTEYTTIEEAARIMADHKISSLPVVRGHRLVGIITETDLFRIFLELFGAREEGVRLTMLVPEEMGMLATLTSEISTMGGNILAMGTFRGEDPTNRMVIVRVANAPTEKLVAVMEALGMEIVDVREG